MEVPTIYKAYFSGLCKGISPPNMARNMVQYLHFRILKFPLIENQLRGYINNHNYIYNYNIINALWLYYNYDYDIMIQKYPSIIMVIYIYKMVFIDGYK